MGVRQQGTALGTATHFTLGSACTLLVHTAGTVAHTPHQTELWTRVSPITYLCVHIYGSSSSIAVQLPVFLVHATTPDSSHTPPVPLICSRRQPMRTAHRLPHQITSLIHCTWTATSNEQQTLADALLTDCRIK